MTRLFIQDDFNGSGSLTGHVPNIWRPRRPPLVSEIDFSDGPPPPITRFDEWQFSAADYGSFNLDAGRVSFTNSHPTPTGLASSQMFLQGITLQRQGYFTWINRLSGRSPEELDDLSAEEIVELFGISRVDIGPTKASMIVEGLDMPASPTVLNPVLGWMTNTFSPSLGFGGLNTFVDGSFRIDDEVGFFDNMGAPGVTDGLFVSTSMGLVQSAIAPSPLGTFFTLGHALRNLFISQNPTLPPGMAEHSWLGPFTDPFTGAPDIPEMFRGMFPGHYFWYSTSIILTGIRNPNLSTLGLSCENGVVSIQSGFPGYSDIIDVEWSHLTGWTFPMGSSKGYGRMEAPAGNITSSVTPDSLVMDFSDLSIPRTPNANFIYDRCFSCFPYLACQLVTSGQSMSIDKVTIETNSEIGASGWHTGHIAAGSGGGGTVRGLMGIYITMIMLHFGAGSLK